MKAIVLGATGQVGSALVRQLIVDSAYTEIKIIHRRSTGFEGDKISETIVDFDRPSSFKDQVVGDVLFSSLGTTMKTAGSKNAQYKVDYTYQYEVAKMAAENGVPNYVLISSAGADSDSSFFYTRMKGELEEAIRDLNFRKIIILQPSVLDGDRKEKRLGERIGVVLGNMLSWIPGIKKYRPIHVDVVASAMRNALVKAPDGISLYKLDELFEI